MLDKDLLNNLAIIIVAVIVGLVGYFRKRNKPQEPSPVLTGIGLGWLEKEQTERLLSSVDQQAKALTRIADSIEELADQRETKRDDHIQELLKRISEMEKRR